MTEKRAYSPGLPFAGMAKSSPSTTIFTPPALPSTTANGGSPAHLRVLPSRTEPVVEPLARRVGDLGPALLLERELERDDERGAGAGHRPSSPARPTTRRRAAKSQPRSARRQAAGSSEPDARRRRVRPAAASRPRGWSSSRSRRLRTGPASRRAWKATRTERARRAEPLSHPQVRRSRARSQAPARQPAPQRRGFASPLVFGGGAGALTTDEPPAPTHQAASPTITTRIARAAITQTVICRSSCSLIVLLGWTWTSFSLVCSVVPREQVARIETEPHAVLAQIALHEHRHADPLEAIALERIELRLLDPKLGCDLLERQALSGARFLETLADAALLGRARGGSRLPVILGHCAFGPDSAVGARASRGSLRATARRNGSPRHGS